MRLDISYVKPCGDKGRLAARIEMETDPGRVREAFRGQYSENLGVLRTNIGALDVIVYPDHVDISNADFEHEILEAVKSLRRLKGTSPAQ